MKWNKHTHTNASTEFRTHVSPSLSHKASVVNYCCIRYYFVEHLTRTQAQRIVKLEEWNWNRKKKQKRRKTNTVTHNTNTNTPYRRTRALTLRQSISARLKPADPSRRTHETDKSSQLWFGIEQKRKRQKRETSKAAAAGKQSNKNRQTVWRARSYRVLEDREILFFVHFANTS